MKHCIDCHASYVDSARNDSLENTGKRGNGEEGKGLRAVRSMTDKRCFTACNPTPSSLLLFQPFILNSDFRLLTLTPYSLPL